MKHRLLDAGTRIVSRASEIVARHPKHLTALIAALALGGGGGAFAVASLAPDASDLPVRQVLEAIQPLAAQGAAADEAGLASALPLYRSEISRSTDTAETLLKRLGIDDAAAADFLRSNADARAVFLGLPGRTISAEATDRHTLLKLSARWNAPDDSNTFTRLVIEKTPTGFSSRVETAELQTSTRLASGTIQTSLFAATDDARLPDNVAVQLAEIFSGDIDFRRALRRGDRFSVVYEALEADGEPLRAGRVLSAEFVNGGKTFQAMWFQEPGRKGSYYALDGLSLRRAYLSAPLEFSRVSSGFANRFHPIHQTWRAHLGVDYAAPTGTAVRTVGDGVVEFAGVQNGYGNVVIIKHRNQHETVYAHLSKIDVQKGRPVDQGQVIGRVGSTGWATGPHLHFEFRVNGVQQDPMTIAKQSDAMPVTAQAKALFDETSRSARVSLAAASQVQVASAQ